MGRIFTLAQILAGAIPTPDKFDRAAALVRQAVLRDEAVSAAVIFGSCAYDQKSSPRSDMDLVVVCDERLLVTVVDRFALVTAEVWRDFHVPLSRYVVPTELVKVNRAGLHGPLVRHLDRVKARALSLRGDVPALLGPGNQPTRDEVRDYAERKHLRLLAGLMDRHAASEEGHCKFLQQCLELPMHLARRHLDYLGVLGDDDCKSAVITKYATAVSNEFSLAFTQALRADTFYNAQLEALRRTTTRELQKRVFAELYSTHVPVVLRYARRFLTDDF